MADTPVGDDRKHRGNSIPKSLRAKEEAEGKRARDEPEPSSQHPRDEAYQGSSIQPNGSQEKSAPLQKGIGKSDKKVKGSSVKKLRQSARIGTKVERQDGTATEKLLTEEAQDDSTPIKFYTELNQETTVMHQNTFQTQLQPYENIMEERSLIDNLVDAEKPSVIGASPRFTEKNMKLVEGTVKQSVDQSKSQFVLETNKSERSNNSQHPPDSDNSDIDLSNSSNQDSERSSKRVNVPQSMNSFSTNNQPGEAFVLPHLNNLMENKTLLAVLGGHGRDIIPEAMPIYRRISLLNPKEPEMYTKLRKRNTIKVAAPAEDFKELCEHESGIEQWRCTRCNVAIAKFGLVFDDQQGRVSTFSRIVYENSFLEDFKVDFVSQYQQFIQKASEKKPPSSSIIYTAYQAATIAELREYMFFLMTKKIKKQQRKEGIKSPFGTGAFQNLSPKLCKYVVTTDEKRRRYRQAGNCLWFDSLFESGNLLQAQKSLTLENTYNLFMQVDTNTRGHQQWFYFRVKGGVKNTTYTFNIMNFTKPGVTGGRGYKSGEYEMRVHYKSKQRSKATNSDAWQFLTHETCQCEYQKTNVARRKKDVIAAGADSDQEEWVEEAFQNQPGGAAAGQKSEFSVAIPEQAPTMLRQEAQGRERPRKRRVFYYYALRFKYQFEFDDDTVYLSFARPIPYTEILEDLHNKEKVLMPKAQATTPKPASRSKTGENEQTRELKTNPPALVEENQFQRNLIIDNPQRLLFYQRTELCRTMSGIPLYKIVVSRDLRCARKNQIVLITSRVHSGETPGSEVFKGIFDFITSDCREAKYLRRFYTFILVPCMNPDGVICGNYRNSVAGVDLNRQWINPEPQFHPEVLGVKNMMQQIKEEDKRQIWIFCDLHGHSKKKNSFFYGCNTAANGGFLSWTIVRLLPRILAQKTHMFNYKDSRFRVEPYKIGTARVVAWKQFQITHSFTLENSFYGYDVGEDESKVFLSEDYIDIGLKFCMAIYDMHFLWKDIKRELRITHGWLKPRTLNELTGVPLAQKVAEEAAIAKEADRKRKAIQQYEEFLRRFYKWKTPFQRRLFTRPDRLNQGEVVPISAQNFQELQVPSSKLDKTRNSLSKSKMLSEDIPGSRRADEGPLKANQTALDQPLNEDLKEAMKDDDEEEFFYRLHTGLVKIQAQVRGYLTRKRLPKVFKKATLQSTQSQMARQKSNQVLKQSSGSEAGNMRTPGIDNSSAGDLEGLKRCDTDQLKLHEGLSDGDKSSHDTAQSLSIFGGKGFNRPRQDWREFFNGEELDKAYQIVEVEQRDESDNNASAMSMGSNSDPSEDNLDEEKMYQEVYGIQNPTELLQTRKRKLEQFIEKVTHEEQLSQNEMLEPFKPKPREALSESKGILKDKELNQRKQKSAVHTNKAERLNTQLNRVIEINNPSNDGESLQQSPYQRESKETQNGMMQNSSLKNLDKKSSQSPMTKKENAQDNMFSHNNANARRTVQSNNQQRVYVMNQDNKANQAAAGQIHGFGRNLSNPVRMIQQSYMKQQSSHKKENINQVIKDCFITKKMNTKSALANNKLGISAQSSSQWAPYQNNASIPGKTATGMSQPNARKSMIKSHGHPGNGKQTNPSPKKGAWQPQKPGTAQKPDKTFQMSPEYQANLLMTSLGQEDPNSQILMHQYMVQSQMASHNHNQLFVNSTEREIASANHRLRNVGQPNLVSNQVLAHDQYTQQMMNQINEINQLNGAYSSSPEKLGQAGYIINPKHVGQGLVSGSAQNPNFNQIDPAYESQAQLLRNADLRQYPQLQNQHSNGGQSQNFLRGTSSISALQKEQSFPSTIPRMPLQFDSAEYTAGALKQRGQPPGGLSASAQNAAAMRTEHKGGSKPEAKGGQASAGQQQHFVVTSGLITDHKEGLNNLFISGKSELGKQKTLGQSLFMKYVKKKASMVKVYADGTQQPQQLVMVSIPESEFARGKTGDGHGLRRQGSVLATSKDEVQYIELTQDNSVNQPALRKDISESWTEQKDRRPVFYEERQTLTDTKQSSSKFELMAEPLSRHRTFIELDSPQKRMPSARAMERMIHNDFTTGPDAALGTAELINEIKQLKDHQQQQLNIFYQDLQQSLNQQIQLQIKNQQNQEASGLQQYVNINQYNMFNDSHQPPTSQHQVITSGDPTQLMPAHPLSKAREPASKSAKQKYSAKELAGQIYPHSHQAAAQQQSLHLQQPRGPLNLQHKLPRTSQGPSLEQSSVYPLSGQGKTQYGVMHVQNGSKLSSVPISSKQGKLQAQDKIPVGLQSLMGGYGPHMARATTSGLPLHQVQMQNPQRLGHAATVGAHDPRAQGHNFAESQQSQYHLSTQHVKRKGPANGAGAVKKSSEQNFVIKSNQKNK